MNSRTLIVGVAVCVGLMASAGQAKSTKTIQVDCTKGDSIKAALETKADELIIEISGMCQERVIIRREGVTLRGANVDPGVDGIVGPSGEPGATALVEVWDVQFGALGGRAVTLEDLSISGSENLGLFAPK